MSHEVNRQVRYNIRRSEVDERMNTWYFLVVNDKRSREEIKRRIFSLFAPIQNEEHLQTKYQGRAGNGLRFELLVFDSSKRVELEDIRGIYKRIIQDRHLYRRQEPHGLEGYLDQMFQNGQVKGK